MRRKECAYLCVAAGPAVHLIYSFAKVEANRKELSDNPSAYEAFVMRPHNGCKRNGKIRGVAGAAEEHDSLPMAVKLICEA